MKIMIIPTSFPNSKNPIKNIFIKEQALALKQIGHDICVLHLDKLPSSKILSKIDTKTCEIIDDQHWKRYTKKIKVFKEQKFQKISKYFFIKEMKKLFKFAIDNGEKPDIIYAHFSCWGGAAAIAIGQEYNIPVVTIEHYSGFNKGKVSKTLKNGLKKVVENSAQMLCVSEQLKERIEELTNLNKKIIVIPNMIDDRLVYTKPTKHQEFRFCAVGNLNPRKRFKLLIEAFCEAYTKEDNVILDIGGAGEEYDNLKKLIEIQNREHQIHLLGRLNREETIELYCKSDCFALPSASETFGIVWRESMAVGRPVITTEHGGWSKDDWSDKFGIKIEVDDKKALIKALKDIKKNYHKYNGKEISDFIHKRYTGNIIANKLTKIFEEVLAEAQNERKQ